MTAAVRLWGFDDNKQRALPARTTLDEAEARTWNRQGFGVFWCANMPRDEVRRIERLTSVRYVYLDIDGRPERAAKREILEKLDACAVPPSRVVDTRNGVQPYWRIDDLTLDLWDPIVRWRLVPAFDGDPRATDPVRVLRVPGFLHQKDPTDPYPITVVRRSDARYTAAQILDAFAEVRPEARPSPAPRPITADDSDDILTAVGNLDARAALERLSGCPLVRCETFTFRPTARGRHNIFCDGRASSCFVDEHGRIGSPNGGGPTAVQWIGWYYGRVVTTSDWRVIADELRRIFPELVKERRHAA